MFTFNPGPSFIVIQDNAEVIGPGGIVLRSMELLNGDLIGHGGKHLSGGLRQGACLFWVKASCCSQAVWPGLITCEGYGAFV